MVTGAYLPVINGGVVQCRELMRSLRGRVDFTVLTTSNDHALGSTDTIEGVPVYRILVDVRRTASKILATLRLAARFFQLHRRFEIVHIHGFSTKTVVVTLLARLFRKKILLALHNGDSDEAQAVRAQGRLAFWAYRGADRLTAVSRRLQESYLAAGLPAGKLRLVPNMVDLLRFRPEPSCERQRLRRDLGLPQDAALILFVGFFSYDKCPDVLFEAWTRLAERRPDTALAFIGATRSTYYDVNVELADRIKQQVRQLGAGDRVTFVEKTEIVEQYYRAADVFVLPSTREGLPVALLEAMASALPCIVSRLPGITDQVIHDGDNGLLVEPRDAAALELALRSVLDDPARAKAIGARARATVEQRYSIATIAPQYLATYRQLLEGPAAGG